VIDASALRELRAAAGEAAVLEHEPTELDGTPIAVTLSPESADALAATLAVCTRRELGLVVRGGGSRLGIGNPPRNPGAFVSTAALEAVCEVDGDEGVARVGAATPAAALASAARAAGWRSPIEAIGPRATVGGALATAAVGPRTLGLGPARRAALGLDVVLASGERTRCGSRVVKNVTGYDLVKLYVGSFGTLGVLTEGWLRLRPAPEAERSLAARVDAGGLALAEAAARRPGTGAAALLDVALAPARSPELAGAGELVLVELAGDAPVVAGSEAWLRGAADVEVLEGAIDRLHGLQDDPDSGALRVRIAAPAPRLGRARTTLHEAGARVIVHPGLRQAVAFFDLEHEDTARVDFALRAARSAAGPSGGAHVVLEHAPAWAKQGRDVFDAPPATLPLMRALKAQFDPAGVLNRGRFVGGL